jgi:hypothetical protein
MQHIRRQQRDSAVMVVVVVPGEEALTKGTCILDGAESVGELGPIFEGLELALRIWIGIRDVSEVVSEGVTGCGKTPVCLFVCFSVEFLASFCAVLLLDFCCCFVP